MITFINLTFVWLVQLILIVWYFWWLSERTCRWYQIRLSNLLSTLKLSENFNLSLRWSLFFRDGLFKRYLIRNSICHGVTQLLLVIDLDCSHCAIRITLNQLVAEDGLVRVMHLLNLFFRQHSYLSILVITCENSCIINDTISTNLLMNQILDDLIFANFVGILILLTILN